MFNLSESFKSKECRLRVRGTDFFFANSEQVFSMFFQVFSSLWSPDYELLVLVTGINWTGNFFNP